MLERYDNLTSESLDFPQTNGTVFAKLKIRALDWGSAILLWFSMGDKDDKREQYRVFEKKNMDLSDYSKFFIAKVHVLAF